MLKKKWTGRELARACLSIVCVTGTIGIALKFITLFERWVYFPTFPNICDSIFLIFAVLWLAISQRLS